MDSSRKNKVERTRTPVNLNRSEYVFKNNATRKFSPNLSRRPNLNETIGFPSGPTDPKFKTKLSTNCDVNCELECDMVYNDYLQAQMKRQFAGRTVKEHTNILEDQLLVQNENLRKRQEHFKEIITNRTSFQTKGEVMEMMNFLQEDFVNFMNICGKYNMECELNNFKETLSSECDKIVLRNIKPIENQMEYEKLISTLEFCLTATQKIINSGRNFKDVHNLAENIRNLSNLVYNIQQSQKTVSELEQDALYSFLQNMSDFFAKKYNEH